MSDTELADFLGEQRTCRVATLSLDGPHLTPLWFVWHTGSLWLYSLNRSQRWADIQRSPQVAVLVDAGVEYAELHGVELRGAVRVVGEVPRTGQPLENSGDTGPAEMADPQAQLPVVESVFAQKYFGVDALWHDGRHAWLQVVPTSIRSWDFRKL